MNNDKITNIIKNILMSFQFELITSEIITDIKLDVYQALINEDIDVQQYHVQVNDDLIIMFKINDQEHHYALMSTI